MRAGLHVIYSFILKENIFCVRSVEAPRRGASYEYPQYMLSGRNSFRQKKVRHLELCYSGHQYYKNAYKHRNEARWKRTKPTPLQSDRSRCCSREQLLNIRHSQSKDQRKYWLKCSLLFPRVQLIGCMYVKTNLNSSNTDGSFSWFELVF